MKKHSKDPFESAFEDSPTDSPIETEPYPNSNSFISLPTQTHQQLNNHVKTLTATNTNNDEEDEEEEEDSMDADFSKFHSSVADPHKMARLQNVFSQFTEEQMSRYESFRRAAFQKANIRRILSSIAGTQSVPPPVIVAVSGITKMFVGDVVERARIIMNERRESGPIRPCHLREAHRRLKLEGKIFKRKVPRLFR